MATDDPSNSDPPVPYVPHVGASRQYWRDLVLGVNDGLVSIFLLVAGVVGGGLSTKAVLLTAVAGALAGAVSMALGEYLATKSQDQVLQRELTLERDHIRHHRTMEVQQLRDMFAEMGIDGDDLETATAIFSATDDRLLAAMQALEFGVVDSERRSPYMAAWASGLAFIVGSAPPTLPFVFVTAVDAAFFGSAVATGIGLFLVGVAKTRVTMTNPIVAGLENLTIAGVGAVVAFAVGTTFAA